MSEFVNAIGIIWERKSYMGRFVITHQARTRSLMPAEIIETDPPWGHTKPRI